MSDADNTKPQSPAGSAPRGSRRNQAAVETSKRPTQRPKRGTAPKKSKKFMNQQEREAKYQRLLYIGLGIAAAVILIALAAGALWQYQIMPNQVLATVNEDQITRKDYWKFQDVSLYNQARLYENMALEYTGQEQSQFLLYSAQLDTARENVKGNADVTESTLQEMIEDRLYVQAAENQGVDMSNPVLIQTALNTWAPTSSPLVTPIPLPTMIPQRAEWATQTAEAIQTQQSQESIALGTPVLEVGTPSASPLASPIAATPQSTPDMASIETTAESEYQAFLSDVLPGTGLSEQDYLNLFAKPQVARAHVNASIVENIPQTAPQVEVSHILVNTEELADEVYTDISNGSQTFAEGAPLWSQDAATSSNDGQLGWVMKGELPPELDDVIFSMKPGEMSLPIETPFGWHIVMVTGHDDDRALTTAQYDAAVTEAKTQFIEEARAESEIKSDYYDPTPLPTASLFMAPAGVPTALVATPVMAPDLSATPIAGPAFDIATPQASPEATP